MIDLKFVEKLIRALDESGLDHIELERGGTRLRISRSPSGSGGRESPGAPSAVPAPSGASGSAPAAPAEAPEPPPPSNLVEIKSPMVGTFYRSPSPADDPFTDVGERISRGDSLCIIEAMKLMNELESEVNGVVREVCVSNGEPVEYGQVLFRVEPA